MELDWTTFLLEIINFLILVWILKRFLYRPISAAIAKRRASIEQTLANAQKIQDAALATQAENEQMRTQWEQKREQLQTQLTEEISAKRERMMADLNTAIAQEREKHSALEQQKQQELRRVAEQHAAEQATQFAAKLLARFASPALEAQILDAMIADLQQVSAQELRSLILAAQRAQLHIKVISAFPLSAERRSQLLDALTQLVGHPLPADFSESAELMCGLQVNVGPWVLHANLQGELTFFRGAAPSES